MSEPEHSRNQTAEPGRPLHDVVVLPGWEDDSVWGWDQDTGSFYAHLWSNDSTSDAPEIWLTGDPGNYPWPGCIALEIVERTKADTLAVVQALGIAHPEPSLRTEDEIMRRGVELHELGDNGRYVGGQLHALAWTQGLAEFTPGTRTHWGAARPTPAEVDAEHHMITGRVHRAEGSVDGRELFAGADEALWWALGR